MKPGDAREDPAFPVMAMDLLGNVLSRSDSPAGLGTYLTEEVRGLTGARCVLLVQCPRTPGAAARRVVSVNPERRRVWAESPEGGRLAQVAERAPAAQVWRGEEPSELPGLLRREGFELSMVFPLHAGGLCVGAMLVLGLPDEGHIGSVLGLLVNLSTVVALVLRNATLFEEQEQLVQVRTADLLEKNEKLAVELGERERAEAEVQRLNQELERRVADRTAQLEAANKELEAFVYSVSHDLRAPLRHMDGFLDLLSRQAGPVLDERGRHFLENAHEAAAHMGTLIDDLLSFARMGRQPMAKTEVDLAALAREVAAELEPEARGRVVRWRFGALPIVTGDRAMLRTVLANLLENALKFTRPRPEAEIDLAGARGPKGEWVVSVRDNGVGFEMAYVNRLFEVFHRLHRAEEFEGVGVGLANVRRVIARHGGRTWAEGKVDGGATFHFSLPG